MPASAAIAVLSAKVCRKKNAIYPVSPLAVQRSDSERRPRIALPARLLLKNRARMPMIERAQNVTHKYWALMLMSPNRTETSAKGDGIDETVFLPGDPQRILDHQSDRERRYDHGEFRGQH